MVLDLKEVSVALLANCLPFPNFAFVFYTRERDGKEKSDKVSQETKRTELLWMD